MKNLPCYVFLTATGTLVVLAVASSLGAPIPFWTVAIHVVGWGSGAGVVSLFLADYTPRYPDEVESAEMAEATEPEPEVVETAPAPRRAARWAERASAEHAIATLGLGHDPATLTH